MNEKNRLLVVLGVILAIVLFCFVTVFVQDASNKNYYKKISKELETSEKKLVFLGKTDCSWCELFTPSIDYMKEKYEFEYTYINTERLNKKDLEKIFEKFEINSEEFGTPYLVVYEDGEKKDEESGFVDEPELLNFLKNNGFVDKDAKLPLKYINYDEYEKLIKSDENKLIVIGQTTCTYCIKAKPILNKIIDETNVEINYLNYTDLSEENMEKFTNSLEYLSANEFGTPLMLVVKNEEVVDSSTGLSTKEEYIDFLTRNNIIK